MQKKRSTWTGITSRLIATIGTMVISTMSFAQAKDIVVWVDTPSVKYATWTEKESKNNLVETIIKEFGQYAIDRTGNVQATFCFTDIAAAANLQRLSTSKLKDWNFDQCRSVSQAVSSPRFLIIRIQKIDQRNASSSEMLNNLGKPQSTTNVDFQALYFDAEAGVMQRSGIDKKATAVYKGSFFGTTKSDEITGDPSGEAIVIRNENRKRMVAVAKALWDHSIRDWISKN